MKVELLSGSKAHRTVGAIQIDIIADKVEIEVAPDLLELTKAFTSALRQKVRAIRVTSEQTGKRLFNQEGRFVNTLFARLDAVGQWSIRAILNRRAPDRAKQVYDRLVQLVPEVANPTMLFKERGVAAAIEKVLASLVTVQKAAA